MLKNEITKEQFLTFIRGKSDVGDELSSSTKFYLDLFDQYNGFTRFASWNWVAFFFPPFWMLYRRMYLYGFSVLALFTLIELLRLLEVAAANLSISILIGIFGNAIYFYHTRTKVTLGKVSSGKDPITMWLVLIVWIVSFAFIGFYLNP